MGQHLPGLFLLITSLGGCSLLYDPDRLPPAADAPPPPINISPCLMEVSELAPVEIVEGTGAGGSRPALLVLTGKNLVNQNTSVTIAATAGTARTPLIEIDLAKLEVGEHGEQLAVPIKLPVDPSFPAGETVTLDVTVSQDCPDGRVTAMVLGKLRLKGLDELIDGTNLMGGAREYSQINVDGTVTIAASQTSPLILRSRSSVKIAKDISLNATGKTGGPAGGTGGTGGKGLGGSGSPGTGPMPGQTSGAAGGFSDVDPGLNTLDDPNRGSGGAGGDGTVVLGQGGDGGGGGGSIEITAGGDLEVGAISARGAAGQAGSAGGTAGGGGSGGVILLRAGGSLTAGNLDVRSAGTGARGRARYDAGSTASVPAGELGTNHLRGPMFLPELPFAFRKAKPDFLVVGKPLSAFKYFFTKQGGGVSSVSDARFDASGNARITLSEELQPGANQLCLVTGSGTPTSATRNCADIAYLP